MITLAYPICQLHQCRTAQTPVDRARKGAFQRVLRPALGLARQAIEQEVEAFAEGAIPIAVQ